MSAKTPNGDAIRELRIAKGMTQEKLAQLSNVDVKTIYRAERGDLAVRLETLLDLAAALDVPLEQVLIPQAAPDEGPSAPGSYRSLVLRRMESASEYAALAAHCQHYAFRVQLDPDDATAARMRELLELSRRLVLGAELARDRFDEEAGEFSEPGRLARLKTVLEELRRARVSVFANRFVESAGGAEAPRTCCSWSSWRPRCSAPRSTPSGSRSPSRRTARFSRVCGRSTRPCTRARSSAR